jgi:predicted amidohydrolase YtcJ
MQAKSIKEALKNFKSDSPMLRLRFAKLGVMLSMEPIHADPDTKGQLAPGMWADIIVFSQDLFKIPAMDIYKTRVVLTIFDGKVLYRQ